MNTSTEALNQIDSRTARLTGNALKLELTNIFKDVSVAVDGKVIVLYAGDLTDAKTGAIANIEIAFPCEIREIWMASWIYIMPVLARA